MDGRFLQGFSVMHFFPENNSLGEWEVWRFGSFDVLEVHGLKKGVLLKDYGLEICEETRSRRKQITKHDSGIAPSKLIPRHLS